MADLNNDPNARYDNGPNAAGAGRSSNQAVLNAAIPYTGLDFDGSMQAAPLRAGFGAAGIPKGMNRYGINCGPNVAGAPRSVNNT